MVSPWRRRQNHLHLSPCLTDVLGSLATVDPALHLDNFVGMGFRLPPYLTDVLDNLMIVDAAVHLDVGMGVRLPPCLTGDLDSLTIVDEVVRLGNFAGMGFRLPPCLADALGSLTTADAAARLGNFSGAGYRSAGIVAVEPAPANRARKPCLSVSHVSIDKPDSFSQMKILDQEIVSSWSAYRSHHPRQLLMLCDQASSEVFVVVVGMLLHLAPCLSGHFGHIFDFSHHAMVLSVPKSESRETALFQTVVYHGELPTGLSSAQIREWQELGNYKRLSEARSASQYPSICLYLS